MTVLKRDGTIFIHLIAAARPNFMKIAPLYHALKNEDWCVPVIIHTGQHYDLNMSQAFFTDLGLPKPHINLEVGSGTHAEQTAGVMIAYEKCMIDHTPDLAIVVGDVNSTMACTLAAKKLNIAVAHLEAGLRSFDRTMPEEINRLVTDALADILWTPSSDGDENLIREGVAPGKIIRVGNIMIDSLLMMRGKIEKAATVKNLGLDGELFGLVTLHRPSNVDEPTTLKKICMTLSEISKDIKLIFPVHPRTEKKIHEYGLRLLLEKEQNVELLKPMGYIAFMNLVHNCQLVITDSGGLQEETTFLGIPCFTLRPNTERPITISHGTNTLTTIESLRHQINEIDFDRSKHNEPPKYWDGHTATRIVDSLRKYFKIE